MVIKNKDGSYDVGPFPDLGGPFETAAAFFEAWAACAKFPYPLGYVKPLLKASLFPEVRRLDADELIASIRDFPLKLGKIASQISFESGPFPVSQAETRLNNYIIDPGHRIIGVIGWTRACTVPWEMMGFLHLLEVVPCPMEAPFGYDKNGQLQDEKSKQLWREREEYVKAVAKFEAAEQVDNKLSAILNNKDIQALEGAVNLYHDGIQGYYDRVLKPFKAKNVP
jgi:hypothetical protein